MADAITLERRGIPAALVAIDRLVNTTGRAMAEVQGAPDYPIVSIPSELSARELSSSDSVTSDEEIEAMAKSTAAQVEALLVAK